MKSEMENDILKVLVTEEQLHARIAEMGEALYEQFHDKNPLFFKRAEGVIRLYGRPVRGLPV